MMIHPEAYFQEQRRHLAVSAWGAVLLPLAAAILLICLLFLLPFTFWRTLGMILITAAALSLTYIAIQQKLKPFFYLDKYYASLSSHPVRQIRGLFLEEKTEKSMSDGLMMRVLKINAGEMLRGERIDTELWLPAVFSPSIPPGQAVCCEASGQFLRRLSCETEEKPSAEIKLKTHLPWGAYAISPLVLFLLLVFSASLWLTFSYTVNREQAPPVCRVAICTPAYHRETEEELAAWLKNKGFLLEFAYSTTLEQETLYQYLSTYASYEADLIILPLSSYQRVFEGETPPLRGIGEEKTGVLSPGGELAAVILYDPAGSEATSLYTILPDWIAIPSEEPTVLCIAPRGSQLALPAAKVLLDGLEQLSRKQSK